MPSEISDQKKAALEASSSNSQDASEVEKAPVASDDSSVQDNALVGEQKKKKRKQNKAIPLSRRRMVQALGRIEGRILPDGNTVNIATEDGTAFRVRGFGKSGLAVRLLALSDSERYGKFSFWPAFGKNGILLVSFNNSDDWVPQHDSPPVDRMFVCGTIQAVEGDRFSVLVGYGRKQYGKRTERILPIESAPLSEWKSGDWVDLILHRQGEVWLWQGDFHPRGPRVGGQFNSWLPYDETDSSDNNASD